MTDDDCAAEAEEIQPTGVSSGFEEDEDQSLYWTASFYLSRDSLQPGVIKALKDAIALDPDDAKSLRQIQKNHAASKKMAEAMEPLFNDISDRERLGRVDDYLFAVDYAQGDAKTNPDEPSYVGLTIGSPSTIRWETEGKTYEATPGLCKPKPVRLRRFWYVHKNGAVSWHLSFRVRYDHTASDFYFLSMMQKVLAPKEFRPPDEYPITNSLQVHKGQTNIEPLDKVMVNEAGVGKRPFWQAVAAWFAADAPAFFKLVAPEKEVKLPTSAEGDWFGHLVKREPFLEVPGLWMPRFRFMFFFRDETFFHHLLPPLDRETQRPVLRASLVTDTAINCFLASLSDTVEKPHKNFIQMRKPYWEKVEDQQRKLAAAQASAADRRKKKAKVAAALSEQICRRADYLSNLAKAKEEQAATGDPGKSATTGAEGEAAWRLAIEWQARALAAQDSNDADNEETDDLPTVGLVYLFLSGFNQNIIDFMNQDASEILDSIDPIYPANENQETERFFVRFANARALTSYVRKSRSLDAGNDYIGACPYAFLIHVVALHNEFLARNYEREAHVLINDVHKASASGHLRDATRAFYDFRTTTYTRYFADRYDNVFRYDTESDVFEKLEQRRGIKRKTEYIEQIVSSLETQTELLLARLQRRQDRIVTYAVGGVGAFGLFQMLLQIVDMQSAPGADATGHISKPDLVDVVNLSLAGTIVIVAVFSLVLLTDLAEAATAQWRRWFPSRRKATEGNARAAKSDGK